MAVKQEMKMTLDIDTHQLYAALHALQCLEDSVAAKSWWRRAWIRLCNAMPFMLRSTAAKRIGALRHIDYTDARTQGKRDAHATFVQMGVRGEFGEAPKLFAALQLLNQENDALLDALGLTANKLIQMHAKHASHMERCSGKFRKWL